MGGYDNATSYPLSSLGGRALRNIANPPPFTTENFDSYANGPLNTQGPWLGDNDFVIQGVVKYQGTKALEITGAGIYYMSATCPVAPEGLISVMLRRDVSTGGATTMHRATIDDLNSKEIAVVEMYGPDICCLVDHVHTPLLSGYNLGQWYKVDAMFRDKPDLKTKYRVDDGPWTAWLTRAYADSYDPGHRLHLVSAYHSGGAISYFDYIT